MKREISYLQANMYYFVYHITTIALYWQEKSTLLMNENKRIDNPWIRIVKCVGVEAQDEKTVGIVFNKQNSKLLNWSLPTEEISQVHA